ncbi:LysR family transcriptional regulator [Anaerolentibacter hominis]|uniref:LysR family transcriptional regulator n=1 Tax=Anaerolentibacter hominis TaxID=3079009 RepID=UPI0031B828A1
MDINFELYKVFYCVAKTLSFSEAAKELFISQSAVSQSVKLLEKRLGQALFVRSTKKVRLTTEGEILLRHIEPAIQLIHRGEKQILESGSLNAGQIRIGASDTICRYFLVPYLNEFHKKHPNVMIKVTNGTSFQCVDLLENNQVDFIIVNSPNVKLNRIKNIEVIHEFSDVFIASKKAFPDLKPSLTLEELQRYPILMLEKNSTTSEFLYNLFLQHQLELVPSVELSSNDLLIDLARIGLGIAFVPDFCINGREEDLSVLSTSANLPKRKLVVASADHVPLSTAVKAFIHTLKGEGSEYPEPEEVKL